MKGVKGPCEFVLHGGFFGVLAVAEPDVSLVPEL